MSTEKRKGSPWIRNYRHGSSTISVCDDWTEHVYLNERPLSVYERIKDTGLFYDVEKDGMSLCFWKPKENQPYLEISANNNNQFSCNLHMHGVDSKYGEISKVTITPDSGCNNWHSDNGFHLTIKILTKNGPSQINAEFEVSSSDVSMYLTQSTTDPKSWNISIHVVTTPGEHQEYIDPFVCPGENRVYYRD